MNRTETDFIGEVSLPENALYGIHSYRACKNFPNTTPFHTEWYMAMGYTKLACYLTYRNFANAIKSKNANLPFALIPDTITEGLINAASQVSAGHHFEHFIVPAIQGGAGTSINMNINEIITNQALIAAGHKPGNYSVIDPFLHANIYQSTNDVVPTALKVAVLKLLPELEESINKLRFKIEETETRTRHHLRIAYTQMQEAVPSSYGILFSTYNEALSRDWWRVSKCFERIKVVNLGGSAIGTAIANPRYFVMEVVSILQQITQVPVTRSENLCDSTANLDSLVEVHAILKAHAVNLEKMVSDLRLLSSELFRYRDIYIPKKQVGSSIMPSKVNPVIPEFVISAAHKIYANDQIISSLSAQGCLELNAYIPVIGHALIDSIKLLIACNNTLLQNLFTELEINALPDNSNVYKSASVTTALLPFIGYHNAALLGKHMREQNCDIFEANNCLKILDSEKLNKIMDIQNLLKTGFSVNDFL